MSPMTIVYTFLILASFWVLLSGQFDLFHLTLGALCCLLVSLMSHDLLFRKKKGPRRILLAVRFALYLPWLFLQILAANLHVAYLSLHPRMKDLIDPKVIKFNSKLKNDVAKVTLGNSITLTPGTITVHIVGDEFVVHAIDRKAAGDLPGDEVPSEMERRIAHVFDEK
jgi:multicomponent Na+:H+ antiporter subunit E